MMNIENLSSIKFFLIKFQALRPAKFLCKKRISLFHYLKETSKHVFSHEYCKIFDSKPPVASLIFSSNRKKCGMVSTKKGRSGHSMDYLFIISRNHFNMLLLINLQKPKTCPK